MKNFSSTIGLSVALLTTIASPAFAKSTPYVDVPSGAYYEDAAAAFLENGALDSSETFFRPNDLSTRAEMMKLLVNVYDTTLINPSTPSFSDVPKSAWYYRYIETAAHEGWIHGDRNCYGTSVSMCTARPSGNVNRAEMAIILQRAFRLAHLHIAPIFSDNSNAQTWYHKPIQVAADHCVLRGDGSTGLVRPSAFMNRAEMIVMADRAQKQQHYGRDCAELTGHILSISTPSSRTVRMTFNTDLDSNRIGDIALYAVEELDGTGFNITDSYVVNGRTVELSLSKNLTSGTSYHLRVANMRTQFGSTFSDTKTFVSTTGTVENATIANAVALSSTKIRLTFYADLDEGRAEDESRYSITRINSSGVVSVQTVTLISARTVEVTLSTRLVADSSYRIGAQNLMTDTGKVFSDSTIFAYSSSLVNFEASLRGAQEVPSVSTTMSGSGSFMLTADGLQYTVSVRNLSGSIVGAHFHYGDVGTNGPALKVISFNGTTATGL